MKKKLQIISILSTLLCVLTLNTQAQTWTKMANFPGVVRESDAGFSIGHYGFIGVGTNGTTLYADFYKWNQTTNTWSAIADYPGAGDNTPIAFTIEGKGYVGLGWTGSAGATDFWQYDTTAGWTAMATFLGTGRYDASYFVIGHKAFIIGGSSGGTPYLNDVWMYDAHQNTWTQKNNCPLGEIVGTAAFTIGNHAYICGGLNGTSYLNTCFEYDTTNDSWTSIASLPLPDGLGGTSEEFVLDKKAYLCEGYTYPSTPKALSDGYAYDTVTKAWSVFTNMGTNGIERYSSTAFSIGNYGYIGTGKDSIGGLLQDFWQYGPNTTGIEELKSSVNISLFPNPSKGILHFLYTGTIQQGELQITDLMGRIIDSHEIAGLNGQMTLNETALSNGMYFYKVTDSGNLISSGKFIIAK